MANANANAHAHAYPIPHDLFTQEIPPSPTLTNPDMILPYHPLHTSSPTPRASSPILQSSLPLRPDSAVSLGSSQPEHESSVEVGVATTVRMPSRGDPTISTGYNGYEHGAALSDIGEEETPRSRKSRKTDTSTRSDPPSPTPAGRVSHAMRRLSSDSSTSTGSDPGDWEDFDTSKIMDERLAADVAKVPDDEVEEPGSKRNSTVTANPEDEMALLNERAERILENARKRLTHMEDHLSKARHGILMSARSSPNMSELHHPAGGLYRSISAAGASHRKARHLYPVAGAKSTAHTRGGSDVTTTSGLKRLSIAPEARSMSALEYGRRQESPQTLSSPSTRLGGYSPVSNHSFSTPLRVLQEEQGTPSTPKTSPEASSPRGLGINALAAISKENMSSVNSSPTTAVARSSSAMSSRSKELREQMWDLRTRISDLKEKAQADSLKRRSMQSIRSASPFTNAHPPEQWYASAPEYQEAGSPLNTNAGKGWSPSDIKRPVEIQITPVTPQTQTFINADEPTTNDSRLLSEARTDQNTPSLHKAINITLVAQDESMSIIQESMYEDAAQELDDEDLVAASQEEQIYLNEVLEESLQEAEPDLPGLTEQILSVDKPAERHEDRVDAFDYENMFLHSALGNYTGTGIRSHTPSESDGSSIATTRVELNTPTAEDYEGGADLDADDSTEEATTPVQETFQISGVRPAATTLLAAPVKPWMKAVRSNSLDSTSTVATFATAAEGGGEGQEETAMPNQVFQWGNEGINFPRPPVSPQHENPPPRWSTTPSNGRFQQGPTRTSHVVHAHASTALNGVTSLPTQTLGARFTATSENKPVQDDPVNEGAVDHPANTEILMESLVKLADPDFKITHEQGTATFTNVDKTLVLDLLRAVGGVCNQILKAESSHEVRAAKVLRRRLDESRKLLEGQMIE